MHTHQHLSALALGMLASWLLTACPADDPLGPAPGNMTGSVSSTGQWTTSTDEADESSDIGDLPSGCSPFEDPQLACGTALECDPETLTCVSAPGDVDLDEPCSEETDCVAGLACYQGTCTALCDSDLVGADPEDLGACPEGQVCALASAPLPGVCRSSCLLIDQDCDSAGFACNRVDTSEGLRAGCTPNDGFGLVGAACSIDEDCGAGRLCTAASQHTLPCDQDASACCAEVCDPLLLPCFGVEPVCYSLLIPDQPDSGFCGVE
ncbi:MAG: hypothetical protein KC457_19785 [Myxococcales bacterium]|nr:hypothetical protein [Myxococcales bacterium]